ncbi:MAG TPA: SDR family NAD(P)-dependent oxidoreductase [Stellaceae bacterium]|nr:SDR family NAD(P)-dependent oxidoreductase [Stellaceae bacterium]
MRSADLFDVRDLVCIVTGGAGGIGRAYAEAMLDNGARVRLLDRDPDRLDAVVGMLRDRGEVDGTAVDVTDRAALRRAIDETASHLGRLDVVFANAGIDAGPGFLTLDGTRDEAGAIETLPDGLWDRVIATNLTSVLTTIQASVPHMKRQGGGRIIATASIGGLRPSAIIGTPYGIAKAAVNHLVRQAALELARYKILVNAILPGPFLTPLTTPELEATFARGSPSHRVAATEEIQGLALFLASPASRYVTGTHMVIDGGAMLGRAD